ncbi:MAG: cytochrome-c peroxidase [Kofleriaceae bacterium]
MRLLVVAVLVGGCGAALDEPDLGPPPAPRSATASAATPANGINPRLLRRFKPLRTIDPDTDPVALARVELGKELFFDKRMSQSGTVACNSCHALDRGGADHSPTSTGVAGKVGSRNAPTVLNAAWHMAQFWDGRAPDIEAQAKGPILNPDEMAMRTPAAVVHKLEAIPGYVEAFRAAFPGEPMDFDHVARAIAAFEETLVTPARWDRYLRGDRTALTKTEIDGLKLFADVGCVQCHTGELVGASMFQRVGVIEPWPNQNDLGRYGITRQPADKMVFKVPSLRNVVMTGPYFHDGSVSDLHEAVRMMGKHQLGTELTPDEVKSIVAWLGALSGKLAPGTMTPPKLP